MTVEELIKTLNLQRNFVRDGARVVVMIDGELHEILGSIFDTTAQVIVLGVDDEPETGS